MACLLCGTHPTTRRIADLEDGTIEAEVCRQCAKEYLLVDTGSPTCEFCSEMADYDLAKVDVDGEGDTSVDIEQEMEIVEKNVICEEHLGDLQADAPETAN